MSYDAQKAYCAKRSSLRCYPMVPTLLPNVPMALNSQGHSLTLSLLGGRLNDSIRLCLDVLITILFSLHQLFIISRSLLQDLSKR